MFYGIVTVPDRKKSHLPFCFSLWAVGDFPFLGAFPHMYIYFYSQRTPPSFSPTHSSFKNTFQTFVSELSFFYGVCCPNLSFTAPVLISTGNWLLSGPDEPPLTPCVWRRVASVPSPTGCRCLVQHTQQWTGALEWTQAASVQVNKQVICCF